MDEDNNKKYEKINDFLNNYALLYSNNFFYRNVNALSYLVFQYYNIFEEYGNKEAPTLTTELDGFTSFELAKEYLGTLNSKYPEELETYLKTGIINFAFKGDEGINPDKKLSYLRFDNKHYDMNINLKHNYHDPCTIVHEFLHIQNSGMNGENRPNNTRIALTEMVSIYFENDFLNYLAGKGYDKDEINEVKKFRMLNSFQVSKGLSYLLNIIETYEKTGNITKDTYVNNKEILKDLYKDDVSFNKSIDNTTIIIKDNPIPELMAGYVFGTFIAYYLSDHKDKDTNKKMLKLNYSLSNDDVLDTLKIIDIDLNNKQITNDIVSSLKNNIASVYKDKANIKK